MKVKIFIAVATALFILPAPVIAEVSPNDRLLQRPEWDGAVVTGPWIEGEFRYQDWELGGDLGFGAFLLGTTYAMPIPNLEQMEIGGRFYLIHWDPDKYEGYSLDSQFGLSDLELWGKYQFLADPLNLAAGLLFTLPVGSEKVVHPRSTGEFNGEIFGSVRSYITESFALVGHLGVRMNSDADYKLEGKVAGIKISEKFDADGKVQFEAGGGVIFEAFPQFNILGELNFASEQYDGTDNDIELTGGGEYIIQDTMCFKGGLGLGIDDGAPDWEVLLAAIFSI